jgi:hypothetical protein
VNNGIRLQLLQHEFDLSTFSQVVVLAPKGVNCRSRLTQLVRYMATQESRTSSYNNGGVV